MNTNGAIDRPVRTSPITGHEYLPEWTQVLRYWVCPYCGVESKPHPDHGICPDQIVTCAACPPLTFREYFIVWQRQQVRGFVESRQERDERERDQRIRNGGIGPATRLT